jgi:hypothetical protein
MPDIENQTGNPEWESNLNGSGTPSEYYEEGAIRRINEGMNGLQAATVIYDNDNVCMTKIKNLENRYDEYKAFAEVLQGGGTINIPIDHEVGSGTTVTMSQSAITHVVNLLQEQINDSVFAMTRVPEESVTLNVQDPEHRQHADYATSAATDINGHSLTKMYYDLEDLKLLVASLTSHMTQVEAFLERIGYNYEPSGEITANPEENP